MTYDEAMDEETMVDRADAMAEVCKHAGKRKSDQCMLWIAFLDEMGDKEEYRAADVLMWLGW